MLKRIPTKRRTDGSSTRKTVETMKKQFSLAILLVLLFGACDKSVEPSGPLYRTWQLVQTQVGKRAPQLIASSERITIAFQPNGRIVYGRNGQDGSCCVPRRFNQKGRVLFVDGSTDQPEFCKYVDLACTDEYVSGSVEWTVVDVDSGQLVLQIGNKLLKHQPYP